MTGKRGGSVELRGAAWMAVNEGLTYAWDGEQRAPYAQKSMVLVDRITATIYKKMVPKVKNRWGSEIWPWDREDIKRPASPTSKRAQ